MLFIFALLLLLHLLERDLLIVELPQIVLLLSKKRLGVPVLGHLLLAVVKCQQVPHAQLVCPRRAANSLSLHLRVEVEGPLEAIAVCRLIHEIALLGTARSRVRVKVLGQISTPIGGHVRLAQMARVRRRLEALLAAVCAQHLEGVLPPDGSVVRRHLLVTIGHVAEVQLA